MKTYTKDRIAVWFMVALVITIAHISVTAQGAYNTIDFPGAIATVAQDINSEGDVVGQYTVTGGAMHGFLLSGDTFTSVDYPGATMTHALGIDPRGRIVGEYRDSANIFHGFVWSCGVFTPIDFPGALTTSAYGINYWQTITGTFKDANNVTRGFTLNSQGSFTKLEPLFRTSQVQTHGVNSAGDVVGCWWVGTKMHSLIVRNGGTYATNDFPGSLMSMNWKINGAGWMAGHYVDGGNLTHGYLASPDSVDFTTIDFPGANLTEAHGINNSMQLVGRYRDTGNVIHGFLYTP